MPAAPAPVAPVVEVVAFLGGKASRAEILAHHSWRALHNAVADGHLVRLNRGWYALPQLPPARQVAASLGGVVSHLSAAVLWGLDVLVEPTTTYVTFRRNAHPDLPRTVRAAWAPLSEEERRTGVTALARTVMDCAATLPFAQGLAIADSALRRTLLTRSDLVAEAASRRGAGAPQARRVAECADGRAANPFESALRATVLDCGLTGFTPQLLVRTAAGPIHADLGDPELCLLLEGDSYTFHGDRVAFENDCRRYDEAVRAGWTVLRITWAHVMHEQEWLRELIMDTVRVCRRRRGAA